MRRREFIALLSGAAVGWPRAGHTQQAGNLPLIGFLGAGSLASWHRDVDAFDHRLRELGWIDGRTVTVEYRWAEGHSERYAAIAAEFVRQKVDVIVTSGSAVPAAKQQTTTIPIVFAVAVDPIRTGMVASLAHPGGNVTGLSVQSADLAAKRLELLREAIPGLRRLAILGNVGYSAALIEMVDVESSARKIGLDVERLEIRRAEDIEPALVGQQRGVGALYVCQDSLVVANQSRIIGWALAARLPAIYTAPDWAENGGLMAYGASEPDLFARAADYVDKILKGTKPGDIPVEQPTKFQLVVNLKTAKALGLVISESFLALADEVIE